MAARRTIAWTGAIGAALLLALLFWAWRDGGREDLRDIRYSVPVPAEPVS